MPTARRSRRFIPARSATALARFVCAPGRLAYIGGAVRLDEFPREIVTAFEKQGFIWGGKWAHFDILHFEYRPELIIKSMYHIEQTPGEVWYAGFPETEEVMGYVEIIDGVF